MNSETHVRRTGLLKAFGGLIAIYALWPLQLMALLKRMMDNEEPSSILDAFEYPLLMAMTLSFSFILYRGVRTGVRRTIPSNKRQMESDDRHQAGPVLLSSYWQRSWPQRYGNLPLRSPMA